MAGYDGQDIGIGFGIIVILILIIGGLFCIAVVPAGNLGISDTFGSVADSTYAPGFYFKLPITSIIPMTIQTQRYDSDATAASSDLQDVSTKVTLNFRLDGTKAVQEYKTVGINYADKVIVPAVQESVKASTAKFTAEELITKRPVVKQAIDETLAKRLEQYGIIVETVSITDFRFSQEFTAAVEQKVVAQQSALQAENKLQQVKVEAEQAKAQAEGQAAAIKINADAQAYQLEVINNKLTQNPNLLEYKAIEKWSGQLPAVVGNVTPFISIDSMIGKGVVSETK